MEDAFLKYMCRRVEKKAKPDPQQADGGPVITISRQYGCHGQSIGIKLVEAINRRNQVNNRHCVWQFISKEILYESAKELNMSPAALYELTTNVRDDIFSNLTTFFADNYYTDSTRRCNTIARILYSYAQAGNVVILGRAGESVTKNMKRSQHQARSAHRNPSPPRFRRREHLVRRRPPDVPRRGCQASGLQAIFRRQKPRRRLLRRRPQPRQAHRRRSHGSHHDSGRSARILLKRHPPIADSGNALSPNGCTGVSRFRTPTVGNRKIHKNTALCYICKSFNPDGKNMIAKMCN